MILSEAKELSLELMSEFGLEDWEFKFDNAKRRFGRCNHTNKLIQLSKPLTLMNERKEVEDTIRHEIAHALVNAREGHSYTWRIKARECGAKPIACYSSKEVNIVKGKFIYKCPNCNFISYRHRKIKRNISCRKCCNNYNGGYFTDEYIFEYQGIREDTVDITDKLMKLIGK